METLDDGDVPIETFRKSVEEDDAVIEILFRSRKALDRLVESLDI